MDFTTYPRFTGRDEWPPTRSEQLSSNQPPGFGKFLPNPNPWQSNSESPSSELQGSANRTLYPGPGIPSGGCFAGVPDSSCALSLLSNQPCDSRNRSSSLGANYLLDTNVGHMVQPAVTHGANISHFSSSSWGFKGNEAGTGSFDMHPELGLGQISQPGDSQYTADLQLTQQSGRQYMDLEHSRAYDSSAQHMHWSL